MFLILRKKRVLSLFNQAVGKEGESTGELWLDSLPSGEFVWLQKLRIEPLNYPCKMCVLNIVNTQKVHTGYIRKKMILLLLLLPNWRKGKFD